MQLRLSFDPILIACQVRPDVSMKHVTWGSALLISWSLQEQIYTFLHSFPPRGRPQWQPAMAQRIRRKLQCWLYRISLCCSRRRCKFVFQDIHINSWETENVGGAEKNDCAVYLSDIRHLSRIHRLALFRFELFSRKFDNCLVGEAACRPVQKYIDTKGIKGL